MKKLLLMAALVAAFPWSAAAQVEKQVEVTKAYTPTVERAEKLPVAPDMTDTVMLRPEIDYTVTPLSFATTLTPRAIRPAQVTYWEFNRPLPCYARLGAGFPLNSVADLYYATQNPSTGYLVALLNHEGRYADIENEFGLKNSATRLQHRVGLAVGKYLGKHILEGEVAYENRLYHRYGLLADADPEGYAPDARVGYGDLYFGVRIGDDFQDLSRLNFEVALRGGLFFDHAERPADKEGARQMTLGATARIAKAFGRNSFAVQAGWQWLDGEKVIAGNSEHLIQVGVRYGRETDMLRLEVGADYYYDHVEVPGAERRNHTNGSYLIPFARLHFNLQRPAFRPFVEVDGAVRPNDYRSLSLQNPYFGDLQGVMDRSAVDYNTRLGFGGSLARSRFSYRLYAGFTIRDNQPYWYTEGVAPAEMLLMPLLGGAQLAVTGRQSVVSINGELAYRPVSQLDFSLGLHGYLYNDEARIYIAQEGFNLENGLPELEGEAAVRYEGRKIAAGVALAVQSQRTWSSFTRVTTAEGEQLLAGSFKTPYGVDLSIHFDWRISSRVGLFAEGRNLLNRELYRYAWYPEYGANFTVGAKVQF